ncbi:MAG: hypothetical protein ACHEUT_05730 [Corynebacterium pyruviciproducens]|uniref:hypothetical protein n=1 Tax=Corynebacterium pyruviciproducens TaxID=598660 RepID=UPI003983C06E
MCALTSQLLVPYLDGDYDWTLAPSDAGKKETQLILDLKDDENLAGVYVHSVNQRADDFDVAEFLFDLDAKARLGKLIPVTVTPDNLERLFLNFTLDVFSTGAAAFTERKMIEIFIRSLKGDRNVYVHPAKKNTLVLDGDELTGINSRSFETFWQQYDRGSYTLDEIKRITEIGDTLLGETSRRLRGDFYTPPMWVDRAHQMIGEELGENWRDEFIVWDPACGMLNLTRDYRFKDGNLFCSTLFEEDLRVADSYNKGATKFQYDFLNDDMVLHEDGMIPDKARELARSGKLKMPQGLATALADNKPIVFYGNPPYGQSGSGQGRTHKAGVNNTRVGELMDGLGHTRMELYTQFIWRTKELAKVFGYTADFHLFFNKGFLTSPNFGKFVADLTSEFTYRDGFMMSAGEFSGTSSAWGVIFSHFEIGGTNQREFTYTVLESDKDMSIDKLTEWTGRSVSKGETLSDWVNDKASTSPAAVDVPVTKNGYDEPTSKTNRANPKQGGIAYLGWNQCNVQGSDKYVCLFSMPQGRDSSYTITPDNLTRAAVTFSIRRSVQEAIAAQKLLWVRDKDIFTRPSNGLLTDEFITDCVVYSLFDRQSKQTSLRDYEYNGNTYRVINEFFPFSRDFIYDLAKETRNFEVQEDADTNKERFVYEWLTERDAYLSQEARDLLDTAKSLIADSFYLRDTFAQDKPRYQTNSWDAGWVQVNRMIFGQDRVTDEFMPRRPDFQLKLRTLGDKIATAAMADGVI